MLIFFFHAMERTYWFDLLFISGRTTIPSLASHCKYALCATGSLIDSC